MKILVSGSSGLVGTAFRSVSIAAGHEIIPLVRRAAGAGSVLWDPLTSTIENGKLEGLDAVVHLAGENIAAGRWTAARKAKILESRVKGTRLLSDALSSLKRPPSVMVSVSAIGFYGDRGTEILRESSPEGNGFLADVCRQWENAAESAVQSGIRVVHPRLGVVLAKHGGALPKMVLPFKLGVGGRIGSGQQYMSWIALDDLAAILLSCVENKKLSGAVNAVAPFPVTNAEFTKVLGRVLSRPTLFPLPAFVARILLGEMADALLLASTRVDPEKLRSQGFPFRHTGLEEALRHILL